MIEIYKKNGKEDDYTIARNELVRWDEGSSYFANSITSNSLGDVILLS